MKMSNNGKNEEFSSFCCERCNFDNVQLRINVNVTYILYNNRSPDNFIFQIDVEMIFLSCNCTHSFKYTTLTVFNEIVQTLLDEDLIPNESPQPNSFTCNHSPMESRNLEMLLE